jgi:hypothetical protein
MCGQKQMFVFVVLWRQRNEILFSSLVVVCGSFVAGA